MNIKDNKHISKVFKAFCDDNRLMILDMLISEEKCACELLEELHISQSTLSHHMKILCESGIVSGRKDRKWMYYIIDMDGLEKAKQILNVYTPKYDMEMINNTNPKKSCL